MSRASRWVRSATSARTPSAEVSGAPSLNWAASWKSTVPGSGQSVMNPASVFIMCQLSRSSAPSATRTSATSIGAGSTVSPVIAMPRARRTAERPPAAATR